MTSTLTFAEQHKHTGQPPPTEYLFLLPMKTLLYYGIADLFSSSPTLILPTCIISPTYEYDLEGLSKDMIDNMGMT